MIISPSLMKYFCAEAKILKFGAVQRVQAHRSGFVLLLLTLGTKEEKSSKTIEAKLKLKYNRDKKERLKLKTQFNR